MKKNIILVVGLVFFLFVSLVIGVHAQDIEVNISPCRACNDVIPPGYFDEQIEFSHSSGTLEKEIIDVNHSTTLGPSTHIAQGRLSNGKGNEIVIFDGRTMFWYEKQGNDWKKHVVGYYINGSFYPHFDLDLGVNYRSLNSLWIDNITGNYENEILYDYQCNVSGIFQLNPSVVLSRGGDYVWQTLYSRLQNTSCHTSPGNIKYQYGYRTTKDIAYTDQINDEVGWFEWDGTQFVDHLLDSGNATGNITTGDIDGNGFDDIIIEEKYVNFSNLVVYRNMNGFWYKCTIDGYNNNFKLSSGDFFFRDGTDEILVKERFELYENITADRLYIYNFSSITNDCPTFEKYLLFQGEIGSRYIKGQLDIADIGNDGYSDMVGIFGGDLQVWTVAHNPPNLSLSYYQYEEDASFDDAVFRPQSWNQSKEDWVYDYPEVVAVDNDYEVVKYGYDFGSGCVDIQGFVHNAITGELLSNVSIDWKQGNISYMNDTNENGFYKVESLDKNTCTYLNASNSSYNDYHAYIYPSKCALYQVNASMIPNDFEYNDSAIVGVVTYLPFQDELENATVSIENPIYHVHNETFNSSTYDTWVSLTHDNILNSTNVSVINSTGYEFNESEDYVIGYSNGSIKVLSTGNMSNNTSYNISYCYQFNGYDSVQTNNWGFYKIDSLHNGTYNINISKDGYFEDPAKSVSVDYDSYTIHSVSLSKIFNLTIRAEDAVTSNLMKDWQLSIKDSPLECTPVYNYTNFWNVTNYSITVQLGTGLWEIKATKDGYYPGTAYFYLYQNDNVTLHLIPVAKPGYYEKHLVEFRFIDGFGRNVPRVNVSAVGVETTMGNWRWLNRLLGYNQGIAKEIPNTTMSGYADDSGHITFMMVQTIKYRIRFTKSSEKINETMYFYPKEEQYTIILTPTAQPNIMDHVSWNLSINDIPGDTNNKTLNLTYKDDMNKTTNLSFFVLDANRTEIYRKNFTDNSTINTSYTVSKESGVNYFWGFEANHETFGKIEGTKSVTFHSRLIDLKLKNEAYYNWISIALLFFVGTLFSAVTVKFGCVIVPFLGGFFYYIGWLSIPVGILVSVIVLGILVYMGKKEREMGI